MTGKEPPSGESPLNHKIKLRNLIKGLRDQGPFLRFIRNIQNGNIRGLLSIRSHVTEGGKLKVSYPTKDSVRRAAEAMSKKTGNYFSNYKCVYCDGYHIGKNRANK